MPLSEEQERELLDRVTAEAVARPEFILPLHLDLHTAMCLVGALQLALRHPRNIGPASQIVRNIADSIIDRLAVDGLQATAEMLRLGDRAEYDTQYEVD